MMISSTTQLHSPLASPKEHLSQNFSDQADIEAFQIDSAYEKDCIRNFILQLIP